MVLQIMPLKSSKAFERPHSRLGLTKERIVTQQKMQRAPKQTATQKLNRMYDANSNLLLHVDLRMLMDFRQLLTRL